MSTMNMTGGEALALMLKQSGIEYMFGMGGFQLLPFYDALAAEGNRTPRHMLVADERSGAFMADAYARIKGGPGLCDGTMGPGATNLTNGLIESYHAGIPVVAVVGDSNRLHSTKNMTQETRQREVLGPIVKEYITVEVGTRLPELVRRAFLIATAGRPGPVVLCVPETVAHGSYDFIADDFYIPPQALSAPAYRPAPDPSGVSQVMAMLKKSKRPVLLAGGGIHLSGAWNQLKEFAESFGVPVAHTISGTGCLPGNHRLCLGLFGRYDRVANELIQKADLLLALGFKFGEIATNRYSLIPPRCQLVHIDICPEEIGRHQPISVGIWADAKLALRALMLEAGTEAKKQLSARKGYLAEIDEIKGQWHAANRERLTSRERPLNMGRVCHELSLAMPPEGILLADGGFAAHWTALLYDPPSAGRTYVANRGNAAIGYGIPGGIGAQLAAGHKPVVAITGDGGLNMSLGDLEFLVRNSVPLTLIVVNNAASGYVKALQHGMYQRYQSSDLSELNYAEIFKAMGGDSIRVDAPGKLAAALSQAIADKQRPVLVDMITTRDPGRMLPATDSRTGSKGKALLKAA